MHYDFVSYDIKYRAGLLNFAKHGSLRALQSEPLDENVKIRANRLRLQPNQRSLSLSLAHLISNYLPSPPDLGLSAFPPLSPLRRSPLSAAPLSAAVPSLIPLSLSRKPLSQRIPLRSYSSSASKTKLLCWLRRSKLLCWLRRSKLLFYSYRLTARRGGWVVR